jgi:hypothetical protein
MAGGCGGGGGTAGPPPVTGTGSVGIFVTDAFSDDFDHVWVTIHKVELVAPLAEPETVFDDAEGQIIDLTTLRDAAGQRFAFLAVGQASRRTHTAVRVTLASQATLFARGSATGIAGPSAVRTRSATRWAARFLPSRWTAPARWAAAMTTW